MNDERQISATVRLLENEHMPQRVKDHLRKHPGTGEAIMIGIQMGLPVDLVLFASTPFVGEVDTRDTLTEGLLQGESAAKKIRNDHAKYTDRTHARRQMRDAQGSELIDTIDE
jgi:hypothetical protein